MRTVKDWESKCLFYDEEEEVIILRKKAFILKNLIRHSFTYISQHVTRNKVKIADIIDFKNENIFFCSSFSLIQRASSGSRGCFVPCVVTIPFIRKGCVLLNCHCSLNKQWCHRHCSY